MDAALAPARAALLAQVRAEADSVRERSEVDAQHAVATATAEAGRIRRAARAEGEAEATVAAAAARTRARQEARALVLTARREAYERLGRAAREAMARMRAEPDFAAVRQRMVAAVRSVLGPDVRIVDEPDGGISGVAGGRRLDLSLTRFADRAVEAVAATDAADEEEP